MATMKAVSIHGFGGPEVLEYGDVARPEPTADQILVRVYAASVNPVDWKIRDGSFREHVHLPMVLGRDVAGIIESTGSNVTGFTVGEAIYANPASMGGGYAEYAVVDPHGAAPKPQSLDFIQAAAVPLAALTAWQGLFDNGGLTEGQTVLVHGAAGGVGAFAVQFAKAKSVHVVATGSADQQDYLRDLGADFVIDYQASRFEEVVHEADVVFDTIGGDTQKRSWEVLKPGGILVSTVGIDSPDMGKVTGTRSAAYMAKPSGAQLAEIGQLIDAGKVKVNVQQVLPLRKAREAQELSQNGPIHGKIVLQVVDTEK